MKGNDLALEHSEVYIKTETSTLHTRTPYTFISLFFFLYYAQFKYHKNCEKARSDAVWWMITFNRTEEVDKVVHHHTSMGYVFAFAKQYPYPINENCEQK